MSWHYGDITQREEALGRISKLYFDGSGHEEAVSRVQQFCRVAAATGKSQIAIFCGYSGAGKSSFLEHHFGAVVDGKFTPHDGVLFVEVPAGCTPKSLAQELLKALGDPCSALGNQVSMTNRLCRYLKELNIRVIILDEMQHFIDSETGKVFKVAANWIKQLLNKIRLPVIVVGLPDLDRVIFGHGQLKRRTLVKYTLRPWPLSNEKERERFQRLLLAFAENMPFENAVAIAHRDFASQIHQATMGLVGLVVQLLTRAGMFALARGARDLQSGDFWDAFQELQPEEEVLAGLHNPFSDQVPV